MTKSERLDIEIAVMRFVAPIEWTQIMGFQKRSEKLEEKQTYYKNKAREVMAKIHKMPEFKKLFAEQKKKVRSNMN